MVLAKMMKRIRMEGHTSRTSEPTTINTSLKPCWQAIKFTDLNREASPSFEDDNRNSNTSDADTSEDGTYVLFPRPGVSVPVKDVADKIKKLVILDFKWSTKGGIKGMSRTSKITETFRSDPGCDSHSSWWDELPFVHLSDPSPTSLFWRWHHHEGKGMISTIEALYCAAKEVIDTHDDKMSEHKDRNERASADLLGVMWIFALQRKIIENGAIERGLHDASSAMPFTAEAKSIDRKSVV